MKKVAFYFNLFFVSSCGSVDTTNTHVTDADLRGKTFDAFIEGDVSENTNSQMQFIFHQDSTFVMRLKRAGTITQKTFCWRFVGDSLLTGGINTASEMNVLEKESNGDILMKGKTGQILLTQAK